MMLLPSWGGVQATVAVLLVCSTSRKLPTAPGASVDQEAARHREGIIGEDKAGGAMGAWSDTATLTLHQEADLRLVVAVLVPPEARVQPAVLGQQALDLELGAQPVGQRRVPHAAAASTSSVTAKPRPRIQK